MHAPTGFSSSPGRSVGRRHRRLNWCLTSGTTTSGLRINMGSGTRSSPTRRAATSRRGTHRTGMLICGVCAGASAGANCRQARVKRKHWRGPGSPELSRPGLTHPLKLSYGPPGADVPHRRRGPWSARRETGHFRPRRQSESRFGSGGDRRPRCGASRVGDAVTCRRTSQVRQLVAYGGGAGPAFAAANQ